MVKAEKELAFATNNQNKLLEVQQILGGEFNLLSLVDIGFNDDIAEDYHTLEENASQKAWFIYRKYGISCFADDTGLEVDSLNGEPGVHSARYAGENKNSEENIKKLLLSLQGKSNREAQFRTVISLIIDGVEHLFEGVVKGRIIDKPKGASGFGYDPVFVPHGYNQTFAQMDLSQKNVISHRAKAIEKLTSFLLSNKKDRR